MMTKVKRWLLRLMIVKLCILFVLLPIREAMAGLPLLVVPVAEFVGGLVLQSLGRQALITVGVAANDASWLISTVSLAARAAGILKILVADGVSYEIPTMPGAEIPAAPIVAPGGFGDGSFETPFLSEMPLLRYRVLSQYQANACRVRNTDSTDGQTHDLSGGWWSMAELIAQCNANIALLKPGTCIGNCKVELVRRAVAYPREIVIGDNGYYASIDEWAVKYPDGAGSAYGIAAGYFEIMLVEPADGIKRFKREGAGFLADPVDSDWTPAEKLQLATASALQFKSQQSIVNVSATEASTRVQAATQTGQDVRYRELQLNQDAVPVSVSEQLVKDNTAAAVMSSVNPGTGTNTPTITFPDDYARQNTAAASLTELGKISKALTDTSEASDPALPGGEQFGNIFFKDTFKDLLGWSPSAHYSSCPTPSFSAFDRTYSIEAHCALVNDHFDGIRQAMTVIYVLLALFIVLKA